MRKASNIVLLIGAILGFVAAGSLFLCAIMFILLSTPLFTDFVREGIESGTFKSDMPDTETVVAMVTAIFIVMAVLMVIIAVLSILSSVFALKARREGRKGLYITSLVFGILASEVILVGSIFGLISCRNELPVEVIDKTK